MHVNSSHNVLIIGSGAAGLSVALQLADSHQVAVISKTTLDEGSTANAQGGIAAVFSSEDSIAAHVEDTLIAGANICDPEAVSFVASHARQRIEWLINIGMPFDSDPSQERNYHLTQEGGHSQRRILHAADATGQALENTLLAQARRHPNITLYEHHLALELLLSRQAESQPQICGAQILDTRSGIITPWSAPFVVLACGGASAIYQWTTNAAVSCGDGIALAWRAGCRVANLEFNQFHPTALYHPSGERFLLSEALRGEGALLRRPDGSRFMPDYDARAELAPRDIVARAIDSEMQRLGVPHLYLDISHRSEEFIRQHFPTILSKLATLGIDLTKEPVPIVPAAHYTCGGVVTDNYGLSDINGLFAIGETAYSGLHGANRLASNSLLECLVYGWSAAEEIKRQPPVHVTNMVIDKMPVATLSAEEHTYIEQQRHALRIMMSENMGIVRSDMRMNHALTQLSQLNDEIEKLYRERRPNKALAELRNMATCARLMVRAGLARKESRGLHYTIDYPVTAAQGGPTMLVP
ncbi:L-aspartate oxidase [Salmonella enterica subsp. enterica serovar Choleraesuis]|nr:L-aspartate oxidase [Salmonella enterica subsp. enterica serovar Choleraesuis]